MDLQQGTDGSHPTVRKCIEPAPDGARLLDVGIGTGLIAQRGLDSYKALTVHGVDIDKHISNTARAILKSTALDQITAHQSVYDHTDGPYDGVLWCELHAAPRPTKALHRRRVTRRKACCTLRRPSTTSPPHDGKNQTHAP